MLILTRKQSETIQIGDNVTIRVIKTSEGRVRLGIEAPADVRILRGELAEKEDQSAEGTILGGVKFEDTDDLPAGINYAGYVHLPQAV
jgi:carbon storage regulator